MSVYSSRFEKPQKWPIVLFFLLMLAFFCAAARYDLALDQALYSSKSPFAIWMEAFCWWPAYLPFAGLGAVWLAAGGQGRQMAGLFLCLLTAAALTAVSARYLLRRQVPVMVVVICCVLACAVLAVAVSHTRQRLREPSIRLRMHFFVLLCIYCTIAREIIVNLLKLCWGRARFDEMLAGGSFELFTPFWQWSQAGGSSFPSGHTANGCMVFVLCLLPALFPSLRRRTKLIFLGCTVWAALCAFARMQIGRHFLSDTLASVCFMAALVFVVSHLPIYKRRLASVMLAARSAGGRPL